MLHAVTLPTMPNTTSPKAAELESTSRAPPSASAAERPQPASSSSSTTRFTTGFSRRGSADRNGTNPGSSYTRPMNLAQAERERSQLLRSISHLHKTQRPPTAGEEDPTEWLAPAGLSTAHVVSPLVPIAPPEYDGPGTEGSGGEGTSSSFLFRRSRSRSVGNLMSNHDALRSPHGDASSSTPTQPAPRRSFSRSLRASAAPAPSGPTSQGVAKRKASMPQLGRLAAAFKSRDNLPASPTSPTAKTIPYPPGNNFSVNANSDASARTRLPPAVAGPGGSSSSSSGIRRASGDAVGLQQQAQLQAQAQTQSPTPAAAQQLHREQEVAHHKQTQRRHTTSVDEGRRLPSMTAGTRSTSGSVTASGSTSGTGSASMSGTPWSAPKAEGVADVTQPHLQMQRRPSAHQQHQQHQQPSDQQYDAQEQQRDEQQQQHNSIIHHYQHGHRHHSSLGSPGSILARGPVPTSAAGQSPAPLSHFRTTAANTHTTFGSATSGVPSSSSSSSACVPVSSMPSSASAHNVPLSTTSSTSTSPSLHTSSLPSFQFQAQHSQSLASLFSQSHDRGTTSASSFAVHRRQSSATSATFSDGADLSASLGALPSSSTVRSPTRISFDLPSATESPASTSRPPSRRPTLPHLTLETPVVEDPCEDDAAISTPSPANACAPTPSMGAPLDSSSTRTKASNLLRPARDHASSGKLRNSVDAHRGGETLHARRWASRSSNNLSMSQVNVPAASRASMEPGFGSSNATPPTRNSRLSFSAFRGRNTGAEESSSALGRLRRVSFMRSRPSISVGDESTDSTSFPTRNDPAAKNERWFNKMIRGKRRGSQSHAQAFSQQSQPQVEITTPASPSDAQRDFDAAFGPVHQSSGTDVRPSIDARSTEPSPQIHGFPPSSAGGAPYNWSSPHVPVVPERHDEVGPMGERLSPTRPLAGRQQSIDARSWASGASSSSNSAAHSVPTSQHSSGTSAHTHQTGFTAPSSSDPNTPLSPALEAADSPLQLSPPDPCKDREDSSTTQAGSDDTTRNEPSEAGDGPDDSFVDASSMPASSSAGTTSVTGPSDREDRPMLVSEPAELDQGLPESSANARTAAEPRRRSGRERGRLSQMPRLNSMQVLPKADRTDGGGHDNGQGDSGNGGGSGNTNGGGSGAGGRGSGRGNDGGSSESSGEESAGDEESETDTDGEEEDSDESSRRSPSDSTPAADAQTTSPFFLPPLPMPNSDILGPLVPASTSPDRTSRPGGIQMPPPPTFTTSTGSTSSVVAEAPIADSSAASPSAGRSAWMRFSETPLETPTAGPMHGKTPLASLQDSSYFAQRPAPARQVTNLQQAEGAPPPSPSIITRNRAPSSASSKTPRLLGTPGRDIPPVPPLPALQIKASTASESRPGSGLINHVGAPSSPSTGRPSTSASVQQQQQARQQTISEMLSPARKPERPERPERAGTSIVPPRAVSPNATAARLRPGLYHQQSRSLIDLPSAVLQQEDAVPQVPSVPSSVQRSTIELPNVAGPAGSDFASKPPPTPQATSFTEPTLALLQRRRSMVEMAAVPPAYAIIHRRPEGPQMIYPREEEGKEKLPRYTCAVHIEGYLPRKMEFSAPGVQAKDRGWRRHYFVLHGTSLKVFRSDLSSGQRPDFGEMSGVHVHREPINEDGSNGGAGTTPGSSLIEAMQNTHLPFGRDSEGKNGLIRNYTLQGAESGLAADYLKRRHVVRVRAEGEQFLLQTTSDRHVVDWIEALQAGTNVALDLEKRPMPKFITLPRRRRRRRPREAEDREAADLAEAQRRSLAEANGGSAAASGGNSSAARRNGRTTGRTGSHNGSGADASQDPSARFDEMLREEHEDLVRPNQSASVI